MRWIMIIAMLMLVAVTTVTALSDEYPDETTTEKVKSLGQPKAETILKNIGNIIASGK